MSGRKLKNQVLELLSRQDLAITLDELAQLPAKATVHALFSAICRQEPQLRWRAISAMGAAVARLAGEEMEEARIVMRRLLWSLNDESGGIGWGAPEALAEIMCCHGGLAAEYVHMLISYMREDGEEICQDGNYLEHPLLQRGLLWGVARLSRCRPELLRERGAGIDILPYLDSPDAEIRALAALAAGTLRLTSAKPALRRMVRDGFVVPLYREGALIGTTVEALAQSALEAMNG